MKQHTCSAIGRWSNADGDGCAYHHANWPALIAAVVWAFATPAAADIVMGGNTAGSPYKWSKSPCPAHGVDQCSSELVSHNVTLVSDPTTWFKATLESEYSGNEWKFNYMGGNDNMKGTFDVVYYKAYNDCPGKLGAEIKVNFVPDPGGSPIDDVLWIQTYRETWPGHDASAVDDTNAGTSPGALPSLFYPYQDEDEDAPRWQSSYQYDYFYDKPGDPCPEPGTTTSLRFETYAAWWDDYFKPDGTIEDVGGDGHNVWIHEGFSWGYDLNCVPEPGTFVLLLTSGLMLGWMGLPRRPRRVA